MNIAFLLLFLLFQFVVNTFCQMLIPTSTIYGYLACSVLSSLIIAVVWGILTTPPGFRKDFYRQPGFHRNCFVFFGILVVLDLIFMFF